MPFGDTRRVVAAPSPSAAGRSGTPRPRSRLLIWTAVALAAAVALLVALLQLTNRWAGRREGIAGAAAPPVSWPAGRRRAPVFRLRDQLGRPVSLAGLRGRPVIVTFIDPSAATSARSRRSS
jgi:hypothetical protein